MTNTYTVPLGSYIHPTYDDAARVSHLFVREPDGRQVAFDVPEEARDDWTRTILKEARAQDKVGAHLAADRLRGPHPRPAFPS